MAQKFYKVGPDVAIEASVLGKNSAAFAVADPVTIDTDGLLIVATAGDKIIGYSVDAVTMAADNQTVAKVMPKFIPANQSVLMQYTSDQACTQTDLGAYANLTGTTGAIQVDLAAGAAGQFVIKGFDPEGDGTTTEVIVETAEPQALAFAQV